MHYLRRKRGRRSVRNSLLNLIIGLIWFPLWGFHFYRWYYVKGMLFEGILELIVLLPLGVAFLYDWFKFGMRKLPNFLEQRTWNFGDYSFWATGVGGVISIVLAGIFLDFAEDPVLTGAIGITLAVIHTMRRRVIMGKPPIP